MAVIEITSENYSELINSDAPVIIDNFADWCGPCKMLSPIFDKVSYAYDGKLKFGKLDTEANPEIAAQSNVFSIPCLIIFHNGKEVDRIVGYMPESRLKSSIDSVLAKIK